ncbi:MAG: glucose-6-phosphate dehydrogenase assembly protein OpcA [Armatimonadota bacterium]|jgi:glucose-6-phosphate dehydrogenase assembly protein OpcA
MSKQETIVDKTRETAISRPVQNLAKLDSDIAELYTQAIEQEGAVPTSRAVLLNLIIYATDAQLSDRAFQKASQLLAKVACRTILVDLTTQSDDHGSVSLICGISERGDKRLCGEVIRLYAAGGPVAGMVLPLLIPDVPVYLWVYGDIPPERQDFADLLRVSDHVVADSRTASHTAANLRALERLSKIEGGKRIVRDLGWMSIQAWREATAQHFDAPSLRHFLEQLTEVTIKYSGPTDSTVPESAPLLFAAWLMDRLQIVSSKVFRSKDEGFRITASQFSRPVTLRLIPQDSNSEVGRLISVSMSCGEGDKAGTFTTEAVSDTQLSLKESCPELCLPQKLIETPDPGEAALAAIALSTHRKDQVFRRTLELALQIISQAELADERSARFRL